MIKLETLLADITVAGPPKGQGRARTDFRRGGHIHPHQKSEDYKARVALAAENAMDGQPPHDGPVRLDVQAMLPVPGSWSQKKQAAALRHEVLPTVKPDFDNYEKLAADACSGIVYVDDKQVVVSQFVKVYSDRPQLRIQVRI